jgi:hypothetical protein
VHAVGVAVDVAWQCTRTQQWESCSFLCGLIRHDNKAAFSMGSVPRARVAALVGEYSWLSKSVFRDEPVNGVGLQEVLGPAEKRLGRGKTVNYTVVLSVKL